MIAYAAMVLTVAWFSGLGGYWLAKQRHAALRARLEDAERWNDNLSGANAALLERNQELEQCRRGLIQDVVYYKAREQTLEAQLQIALGAWEYEWSARHDTGTERYRRCYRLLDSRPTIY